MTGNDAEHTPSPDAFEGSLDIAIVGMAARFPKARGVQEYWSNLVEGVCSRTEFTEQELLDRGVDPALLADPDFVRAGYLLEDSDAFDAGFFGYPPREAELMDPQHRVLLECGWTALESAGYDPQRYDGLIGVYAGAGFNTHLLADVATHLSAAEVMDDKRVGIGNRHDFLATKLSYKLGLQGPSINIQSACSTSLVAIVQACQGLLDYQCDMALAGGAAVNQTRRKGYLYSQDGLYSPDGVCRTFDARAEGTVAGEGVGMVVLKRLKDAVEHGDHIHAVIKGGAVNNDGSRRAGFTAPSAVAQADVIATALANADVAADSIRYVEVHGVATILGDPIEVSALASVYADVPHHHCVLGSAKPNIGHLDIAAGVAGLIKAALVVEHGLIPPTLHFEHPNPRIDLDHGPFRVSTELSRWPQDDGPRRAAVSSFGLGGTNAHVILEQPPCLPPPPPTDPERKEHILVLSAKTPSALDSATDRFHEYLREHREQPLEDIAFTLQQGRQAFPYRRALVGDSVDDALEALEHRVGGRLLTARAEDTADRPVGFMFAGVGGQFPGMARQLYEREPVFSEAVDRCAEIVTPILGQDIRPLAFMHGTTAFAGAAQDFDLRAMLLQPQGTDRLLDRPHIAYPAVFALEYGLVQLWASWGVQPEAMIGHSLGEYVAACVAGVFSLPDVLRLIIERARLIEAQGEGAMLVVPLSQDAAARYTGAEVCLAAVNSAQTCVLSGPREAIEQVEMRLDQDDVVHRRVPTRFAFHSPMMDPVVEPFHELLCQVELKPPEIPFVSNVTGDWITAQEATDPRYWARHVRDTVRFADGVNTLCSGTDIMLVELGPGRALVPDVLQHTVSTQSDRVVVSSLPGAVGGQSDRAALLTAAGRLWLAGREHPFPAHPAGRRTALPTYPFERVTYRLGSRSASIPPATTRQRELSDYFYAPSWQRQIPAAPTSEPKDLATRRWLVFLDGHGVGAGLVAGLRGLGAAVRTVSIGRAWHEDADGGYVLDPADPEHFARLADALRAQGQLADRVVHCWGVGADADHVRHSDESAALLDRAFGSLVRWAQATEDELLTVERRWDVLSTEVCQVLGDEVLCPPKAAVQGLCVVLPQEYPLLDCAHLDLPTTGPAEVPALVERLMRELSADSGRHTRALRGRHLWAPAYLPSPPPDADTPMVKRDGVYLITGGLGRIGLQVARTFAECDQVRLVLLGRTMLPPRASWDDPHHAERVVRRIAAVRELEALGAEVTPVSADVSDLEEMTKAREAILSRHGAIDGVVHCAGTTGSAAHRSVAELGPDEIAQHWVPKVHGVHVLDEVLADQSPDFALLCSSIASVLGGPGLGAYAAANAVLDAFAQSGGRSHLSWTSVNWEAWSFSPPHPGGDTGRGTALTPAEGRGVTHRLLLADHQPQVVISTEDLEQRRAGWLAPLQETEPAAHRYGRPNLPRPYIAPSGTTEREVARIWQDLLGLEDVGVNDNFFELGGSSLLGLQVVHRLRRQLSTAVPLTIVYEGPTVRTLAALVDGLKADL